LWNLPSAGRVRQIETSFNGIFSLAFSPDGEMLAAGGGGFSLDGARRNYTPGLEIFNVGDFRRIAQFGRDLFFVKSLAFSPDKRYLLSTNYASPPGAVPSSGLAAVRLWKVDAGFSEVAAFGKGMHAIRCATFSSDGKLIVFAHAQEATVVTKLSNSRFGTASPLQRPAPLIRTWDLERDSETEPFDLQQGTISGISISPSGKLLASSGTVLTLWNIPDRVRLVELASASLDFGFTHCVAFSPDGTMLAAGSGDHFDVGRPWENCGVKLWDTKTGHLKWSLPHQGPVYSLAFSADGSKLVAGGESDLLLWKLNSFVFS
jgi:WD40 repeat protein